MERKLLLLGLLRDSSMHGYQINELIDAHLGSSVQLTRPTAYRFLNQMAENGWVTYTKEKENNRPTRRVYSITPEGEIAFQEMLRASLSSFLPAASHNTIGIAFMDAIPPEDAAALLQHRREIVANVRDALTLDETHHGGMGYLISHQFRHLDTELAWMDDVLEDIQVTQS
ncbi:PadR family transcriptional regulator [Chloroflexota bacterium]